MNQFNSYDSHQTNNNTNNTHILSLSQHNNNILYSNLIHQTFIQNHFYLQPPVLFQQSLILNQQNPPLIQLNSTQIYHKEIFCIILVQSNNDQIESKKNNHNQILHELYHYLESISNQTGQNSQNCQNNNNQFLSFQFDQPSFIVEHILSTSAIKATIKIDLSQDLYEYLISNKFASVDSKYGKSYKFHFFDIPGVEEYSILQNGRFSREYVILNLGKQQGGGKQSTKIFISYNISDHQIYVIKKVNLSAKPDWNRLYNNHVHEAREVKAMLKLTHKNILRIYNWWFEEEYQQNENENGESVGKLKPFFYLYMQTEYICNTDQSYDLLEFIYFNWEVKKITPQKRKQLIPIIFHQILDGVEYVHNQGFYHRDLKPENILVAQEINGDFLVKICDFDYAKNTEISSNVQSRITGSPGYRSPKSCQGQIYDVREEIFMLGMVLLDCCRLVPGAVIRKEYHQQALENKFDRTLKQNFLEAIELFIKMNIEFSYNSIRELREGKEYLNFLNCKVENN